MHITPEDKKFLERKLTYISYPFLYRIPIYFLLPVYFAVSTYFRGTVDMWLLILVVVVYPFVMIKNDLETKRFINIVDGLAKKLLEVEK